VSQHILAHLSAADPVLAGLIRAVGPCALALQSECHPFEALAQAIAHQQLNGTAANTILKRFIDGCGQGAFPTPQMVLAASARSLRAAGFSFAKVAALRDLADKTLAAVVPEAAVLLALGDEEIVTRLTQVRGVGRWTVEMMLMFRLGRPDVLPVDDFGVRSGFRAAYGLRKLPRPQVLAAWGERWRPYRSTAAWYLWRALELERAGQLTPPAQRVRLPPADRAQRAPRPRAAASAAAHLLHLRLDDRVDEAAHVAAEHRDLAYQARGDERELLLGREKHGLEIAVEMARHVGKLKLELEVRHRTQPAHDHRSRVLACELDGEAGVAVHLDVGQILQHAARQLDAFLQREHRRLVAVGGDGDDHAIEDAGGAAHQVVVPVGDRIERARIDGVASHTARVTPRAACANR
jgi:DNA-3-methyladenine glycosylase II